MSESRRYSCTNCGHAYEALPPDDVHTVALKTKCATCHFGGYKQFSIEVNNECENCDHISVLYWHVDTPHTPMERAKADVNRRNMTGLSGLLSNE